ncbi:unnamed protein product (macronuclear) [Paramecium tetraurelia]|uniref:PH domain-containing protein n=1 Tax=Paramecium tetraurelia TaxID=5888 RepID=A0BYB6_PARTE|nr:uncharacterized protein GSPATT00033386001 [Paramecium tetraurelia]CAK63533.1 unnamed protein product [Paramecium tetraurelia]|eukprot:XP_001430931.1 hypothetical protein (macronuclear) [Paramecium tetraurelia strain d4-2]
MNKIKQTEQNLQTIKKCLFVSETKEQPKLAPEEMLKQTQAILNQSKHKVQLHKDQKFIDSKIIVQQQLKERQQSFNQKQQQLQAIMQSANDTGFVEFHLINSMMQKLNIKYDQINQTKVALSVSNKINFYRRFSKKPSQLQVTKINGQLLDENQQQIYKIFNTKEQIHFIFKNEMELNINIIPYQINRQIYREDKNIYEVLLVENQIEEEQNEQQFVEQQVKIDQHFKFSFLNRIQQFNLMHNQNIPSALTRQYNIYLILRELILDALDYNYIKSINIIQDQIIVHNLPSQAYKIQPISNESEFTEQSSENKIKKIEKKVKAQAKKQERSKKLEHLQFITTEQLKDYNVQMIPHNQGYQAQRAIKDHLKETTNVNLQAGSKMGKGGIDKLQKGEYFLKQKGKSQEFHICWLEQRGFHLVWYHLKTDKVARGIGQLDDALIKEEGSTYIVKLLDRSLTIKLEKPYVGQIWRRSISNQIAYKAYLNNLWMICRLFDKSPSISMVDYFFNENLTTFNISNNALQIEGIQNALPLCYITKYTQIIFDSLMNHKIYQLILSNSQLGPIATIQLLQYFKKNKNRLKLIDLSNCQLTTLVIKEFGSFLMNQNSFALNHIYLNDNQGIGNEGIEIIANCIQQRYLQFWDNSTNNLESISPGYRRHQISRKSDSMELELLTLMNFKNIGATNFNDLFNAIDVMFCKALEIPALENELFYNKQKTLSKMIKKLKNKTGQYNRYNLQLLKDFYENSMDPIIEIIKIQLDISENSIQNIEQLGELIIKHDCFRSVHLSHLELDELLQFTACLKDSISLELLDVNCNRINDIQVILESLDKNTSIKTLIISQQFIDLQSRFEDVEMNNQEFFIADVQLL